MYDRTPAMAAQNGHPLPPGDSPIPVPRRARPATPREVSGETLSVYLDEIASYPLLTGSEELFVAD